jgi:hypothetical protein
MCPERQSQWPLGKLDEQGRVEPMQVLAQRTMLTTEHARLFE